VNKTLLGELAALRRMSLDELRDEWFRVFGEKPRSTNAEQLFRKLAYELQARVHGGLPDAAKARLAELAPVIPEAPVARPTARRAAPVAPQAPVRDPRLPSPGTVLSRPYRGREIRVVVHEHDFEWDGQRFSSLSAVARAITGSQWNGRLFFGLTERKR